TSEVSVLDMAGAYAVFANNGNRAEPQAILKITNQDGTGIEQNPPRVARDLLSQEGVKGMNLLTRAVVTSGTGRAAGGIPDAHGKPGTAESFKDAGFVGFTPQLTTAVWCGNRDNSPMRHAFGGTLCAPVWAAYMRQALPIYEKVRRQPKIEPEKPR